MQWGLGGLSDVCVSIAFLTQLCDAFYVLLHNGEHVYHQMRAFETGLTWSSTIPWFQTAVSPFPFLLAHPLSPWLECPTKRLRFLCRGMPGVSTTPV